MHTHTSHPHSHPLAPRWHCPSLLSQTVACRTGHSKKSEKRHKKMMSVIMTPMRKRKSVATGFVGIMQSISMQLMAHAPLLYYTSKVSAMQLLPLQVGCWSALLCAGSGHSPPPVGKPRSLPTHLILAYLSKVGQICEQDIFTLNLS